MINAKKKKQSWILTSSGDDGKDLFSKVLGQLTLVGQDDSIEGVEPQASICEEVTWRIGICGRINMPTTYGPAYGPTVYSGSNARCNHLYL